MTTTKLSGTFNEEGCTFDDNSAPYDEAIPVAVQTAEGSDTSLTNSDDHEANNNHPMDESATPVEPVVLSHHRYQRRRLWCMRSFYVFVFASIGVLIGVMATKMNSSNNSSSASDLSGESPRVADDTTLSRDADISASDTLVENKETTGLLRSTRVPSSQPTDAKITDMPSSSSTQYSSDKPSIASSTSHSITKVSSQSPTTSPTLRPTESPVQVTIAKQSLAGASIPSPTAPQKETNAPAFTIDVSSWIEAFNSITLNEAASTTSTAAATTSTAATTVASAASTSTFAATSTSTTASTTSIATSASTSASTSTSMAESTTASASTTAATTATTATTATSTSTSTSTATVASSSESASTALATEMTTTTSTSFSTSTSTSTNTSNTSAIPEITCLTQEECDAQRQKMGLQYYMVGDHPMKGCFYKSDVAYFGLNGTAEEMASPSVGQKMRIWCGDDVTDVTGSGLVQFPPSYSPTKLTPGPTSAPSTSSPTSKPTMVPTTTPTSKPTVNCFTTATYNAIDNDIADLKNNIADNKERSHFLGGIVRLAAHDFMDYDPRVASNPMGPDGCFDPDHSANAGLPQNVWCTNCTLTLLHQQKYPQISRADFWIASANAVIRQTSVNNALDLKDTFQWGRADADQCPGSGDRLPSPTGCNQVENVFLVKMGLEWKDAVALLGAHTLGRGDQRFSGHHGTWVDTDDDAQRFDKQYYEEIYLNAWRPRNRGQTNQDWTTGRPSDGGNTRLMLNTDICLVHNIDNNIPCCTRTGSTYSDGQDQCIDMEAAASRCPMYSQAHSRWEARQAVGEMLGGDYPNTNNMPFYNAFTEAWRKATTVGQTNLSPLSESCEPL